MLPGQKETKVLKAENGLVRLCSDSVTETYSIGLRTDKDFQWKFISKELHNLLVKELAEQEGQKWATC